MARFLQWSDLHLERSTLAHPIDFPEPTAGFDRDSLDGILIAGDLSSGGRTMSKLVEIQECWGLPVVFVPGNHDFWFGELDALPRRLKAEASEWRTKRREIHVLDCDMVEIAGTRILGATLWTDYAIAGDLAGGLLRSRMVMNDHKNILTSSDGPLATPEDMLEVHRRHRAWLTETLAQAFDGPSIVMTHHIPVPELVAPRGRVDGICQSYASDLRADILPHRIDAWISGHSHDGRSGWIQGAQNRIAFRSNMMGYTGQTTGFDPYWVLDSEDPAMGLEEIRVEADQLRHLPQAEYFTEDRPNPWV